MRFSAREPRTNHRTRFGPFEVHPKQRRGGDSGANAPAVPPSPERLPGGLLSARGPDSATTKCAKTANNYVYPKT